MNERRLPRFSTRLPIAFHVFEARRGALEVGALARATTRDVGPNGCFLAHVTLAPGTRVHFYLALPDGCVEGFGVITHEHPRFDAFCGETPGVGVRFTRLSHAARARIDRFVDERRAVDRAAMRAALDRARAEQFLQGRVVTPAWLA